MKEKRSNRINVRLTGGELAAVKRAAAEEGATISEFARARLLQRDSAEPKAGPLRLAKDDAGERRSNRITIRLTDSELLWIVERAAWRGCTPTALVRMMAFFNNDIAPVVIDTRSLDAAYLELHRQGVNLNQLMAYLNTYKGGADTSKVARALEKAYASLDIIENILEDAERKWHEAEARQSEDQRQ